MILVMFLLVFSVRQAQRATKSPPPQLPLLASRVPRPTPSIFCLFAQPPATMPPPRAGLSKKGTLPLRMNKTTTQTLSKFTTPSLSQQNTESNPIPCRH